MSETYRFDHAPIALMMEQTIGPSTRLRLSDLDSSAKAHKFVLGSVDLASGEPVDIPTGSPALFGRGYDSLHGAVRGDVAVSTPLTSITGNLGDPGAGGQSVRYYLEEIQSLTDLRSVLSISAAASFSGLLVGGDAKFDFYRQAKFHRYSVFAIVRVDVVNSTTTLGVQRFSESALERLKGSSLEEFFESYGDEFVISSTTGGEFLAIVEFVTETAAQQEALSAKLDISGGYWSASTQFASAMDSFSMETSTKIQVLRRGGQGPIPDGANLKSAALNFPDAVNPQTGHPWPLYITLQDLAVMDNLPPGQAVPNLAKQEEALNQLARDFDWATELQNSWAYVRGVPGMFNIPPGISPDRQISALDNLAQGITERARIIIDTPFATPLPSGSTTFDPSLSALPNFKNLFDLPLIVLVHLQDIGDSLFHNGQWAGTKGQSRRLEGFQISQVNPVPGLSLQYMAHLQDIGDVPWVNEGGFVGSRGQSRRLEGFAIRLTGPNAPFWDVIYQAHLQDMGDTGSYSNGQFCGTRGQSRRVEAIRVNIVAK